MDYQLVCFKLILGMLCLIIQLNIMGKGSLSRNNALDQVQNFVLGGIIGGIIYNQAVTILQFVMVLLIWTLIVFTVRFLSIHNRLLRNLISGRPTLLIRNGQLLVENCMRMGMTADDLMFKLRERGIYQIQQVKSGILEQNGQLVVIENNEENIKFPLIADGVINQDVLELIHHDDAWLKSQIQAQGFQSVNDIYLGEYLHGQLRLTGYPSDH